jgi:hypothetical protein
MPTFPLSTGTLITDPAFNELADIAQEILGVGENGWGLYGIWTTPITPSMPIRADSWHNLVKDLVNNCYHHITNINTTTNTYAGALANVSTATTLTEIDVDLPNRLKEIADFVKDDANRYTCAEEQFFVDPSTGAKINFTGGVSERTLPWGIAPDREITHVARVRWASRLVARYFFNTGGYLTWKPYFNRTEGTTELSTADQEWTNFINTIRVDQQNPANEIRYNRAAFDAQNADTEDDIKTYTSGSLYVTVSVYKSLGADYVDFRVKFGTTANPQLVVDPVVGYWNEVI